MPFASRFPSCSSPASAPVRRRLSSRNRLRSIPPRPKPPRSSRLAATRATASTPIPAFDLDQSDIKPEFAAQIACHAEYLRQFPDARVTLEGNADERGSREYNLGLGERRGNAVQGALSTAGASSSQLEVVSYGEERPVCRQHDDSCWSKNRRVEIVYTAK